MRNTHQSYIARQRVVAERLRQAHLPRWKLPRYALDHSIWIDSGWQRRQEREKGGVLDGRESNVHRSLSREGLRREPRIAVYKHNWKRQQNTVYWCNLFRVTQSEGLQFYQTRSNGIILYNTLLAMCIKKVVVRKSGEECTTKRISLLQHRKELY